MLTLGGALGVLSAPRAARAQAQLLPVRLKVGLLQPSDGGAKNIAGSPLYTGEVEVVLPSFLGPAGSSILTAGYQDRSTHGNELRVIPLTISKTSDVPNPVSLVTGKVYYGGGIGAYILHAEKDGGSEDKTTFGGFGVVGYQLPGRGRVCGTQVSVDRGRSERRASRRTADLDRQASLSTCEYQVCVYQNEY